MLVAALGVGSSPIALIGCDVVLCAGTGMLASRAIDVIVSAAPPDRAGAAAAIGETGGEFGGALGIAVLGSVATAVYRVGLARDLPAGLSAGGYRGRGRDPRRSGRHAAQLPPALAGPLLDAAHRSFTKAVGAAAVAGACLLALAAGAAMWVLGRRT